ncbi:Flagellar hook-associated protein 2 HAP2 [Proteiniborus sp. DW1]|uniref:flagellar filament capping protein FliD n=1 Tax=Proteiniborus sp. DW1 TaxID=1889883 RepID=UPI00092E117C|nr:flagellar filament capping protein FliD [Proteiniborus sp. DW1]SCG81953.1 Flagellar hook-associated protein 2 HAP2 [Proteiniborus sp. DW1]
MSSIRLTGLATGIDTDAMIKELMKAERTRVDKVQQDKQILQWRQELYNSINKDFANFILNTRKEFGLNVTTITGSIDGKSLNNLTWVKKAVSSNENIVKASTTSQAANGTHEITVHRLADGVKGVSSKDIREDIDKILTSLGAEIDGEDGEKIKIPESFSFEINDKTITVNKNDTMSTIIKRINDSGAGVQASYDANIGRFFIQTKTTGTDAKLSFRGTDELSRNFIDALKLNITSGDTTLYTYSESEHLFDKDQFTGTNALISFNGATGIEQPTNQFTINGISLDLRQADPDTKITIRVDTDVDAVYNKIKDFVDKYNEIMDKMGKLLSEKKYRDYRPLTSEQKEAMKEKEIELWEEKAKSGILRNDTVISSIMQNIRSSLYSKVDKLENSPLNSLYQLGIETEEYSPGAIGGKLQIDEEKLRKMITEDVNGVLEVLFSEAKTTIEDGRTVPVKESGGVITRIFNNMIDGMSDILGKAGPGEDSNLYRNINTRLMIDFVTEHSSMSTLDKDIKDIDERIKDLNTMLINKENRYYSKFAAMEKFIQQMNSQSSWLMQQLGM